VGSRRPAVPIIQFLIYLCAEPSSQWSVTESARIQTTAVRQHRTKRTTNNKENGPLKAFYTQIRAIKIFIHLQTAFAAETHLAEGQWLKEQRNVVMLRVFQVGTKMPTV
jgi:hypothetical protein